MSASMLMPFRGEPTAPIFDRTKPRELSRFFGDLEHLFGRAMITSASDKKQYVLHYVDFETEQAWKCLPEYSSATASYADFKDAILYFYPEASGSSIYSLRDLDILLSTTQSLGVFTASQLSEYHLQFLAITTFLIKEQQLDELEQRRSYIIAVCKKPVKTQINTKSAH